MWKDKINQRYTPQKACSLKIQEGHGNTSNMYEYPTY